MSRFSELPRHTWCPLLDLKNAAIFPDRIDGYRVKHFPCTTMLWEGIYSTEILRCTMESSLKSASPTNIFPTLILQAESMAPAQVIPSLRDDGSIDTLRLLLQKLVERLQWRSNQEDSLFPSLASSPREGKTPGPAVTADSSDIEFTVITAPVNHNSHLSEDERQDDSALSLPDAVLVRAVLCSKGGAVALASTARKKSRRKNNEEGSGGGLSDEERWRQEMQALARGEGCTITVGEGAAAAERVLKEIKAWDASGGGENKREWCCTISWRATTNCYFCSFL